MKKKSSIYLIVILQFVLVGCKISKQNIATTMHYLTKYEWVSEKYGKQNSVLYERFSKDSLYSHFEIDGKALDVITPYYLSDEQDTSFDLDKIGKCLNGRYLVEKIATSKPVVSEILEINDTCLKLRNVGTGMVGNFVARPFKNVH